MGRWSDVLPAGLRICPACSSEAVMAAGFDAAGPAGLRCMLRCAGCETWRGATVPAAQGLVLEHRVERRLRRDRRRLSHELRRLERGGTRLIGGPFEAFPAGSS